MCFHSNLLLQPSRISSCLHHAIRKALQFVSPKMLLSGVPRVVVLFLGPFRECIAFLSEYGESGQRAGERRRAVEPAAR